MWEGRRVVGKWEWEVIEGWGDGGGEEDVNSSEVGVREEKLSRKRRTAGHG